MRKTKIVATLGPASSSVEIIKELAEAGVNVFRLNFSHGTHETHFEVLENIRASKAKAAIMLDTKGPEIRTGLVEEEVELEKGQELILTTREIVGNKERLSISYANLPREVEKGALILLADGLVELEVLNTTEEEIHCRVLNNGRIGSRKGVNLPGTRLNLPALTEKDKEDIKFGIRQDVDFIAASFIRKAEDVLAIRKILEDGDSGAHIIAKIENQEGIENIDEIIEVADGIMVARGDMGVEIATEKVPMIQKEIIEKCNEAGKPVITATQMLESMIRNPRPTRAEASDVANAILDGTDATMLSGETAAGSFPVASVKTMASIAGETERSFPYREKIYDWGLQENLGTVTDSISYATCATAEGLGAAAIITATRSGYTARMVSKYRPRAPIIAATPNAQVLKQLYLSWGVYPISVESTEDTDAMIESSVQGALLSNLIQSGDLVVITAGTPVGIKGTTNLLKVHTAGQILARGTGIGKMSVTGTLRLVRTAQEALDTVEEGDILVARETDRDFIPALEKAGAVVTEQGGITSHAAIVGLNLGMPVVVGVEGALETLPQGETVTVDGARGLLYRGVAKVL